MLEDILNGSSQTLLDGYNQFNSHGGPKCPRSGRRSVADPDHHVIHPRHMLRMRHMLKRHGAHIVFCQQIQSKPRTECKMRFEY